MDELYISVPEEHASGWACQLPMLGDDISFLEVFPTNSKILKIYNGQAIISLYLGAIQGYEVLADMQGETELEDPLSDENYQTTNEALCLNSSWVFATKEQLFEIYPELEGTELVGQDEDGVDVYRDKILFPTWAR